ncbi:ribosome maturation factor RimM [Schnuerera ultunensis]|uniref:Ribosome maturation factor RimM n=1 Tax=[Clostridium] ultunense Esp TaxID=1288971 RepID=A0A1M4PND3_9FIRM|nr:ribosome maturation factor RimM [Schnuerera ultunensis]SHD76992.1 Ribosome maturation factor RimM [[Clostridium] ultunense Esp]
MDYIKVGWIMNTHGIKGELKVYPLTDDINRFSRLETAYLGEDKLKVEIEEVKYNKGLAILKFKEFNDINEVLSFKENYIFIDEEDKMDLPNGHYYIFEIIDCIVFDTKGEEVGTVVDVIQSASNDIYVVKNFEKDKEYLIPAVKEFFVNIDIPKKKIIIDPIKGMIE